MRIAVVGAGVAGLAAAAALQRASHDVTVYERVPAERVVAGSGDGPSDQNPASRPEGAQTDYAVPVWCNGAKALQDAGLAEVVAAAGEPITSAEVIDRGGHPLFTFDAASMDAWVGSPSVMVSAAHLRAELLARLSPGTVEFGRECVALASHGSVATVGFSDRTEATCDLVIGADGIDSTVRSAVAPKTRIRQAGFGRWQAVTAFNWTYGATTTLTSVANGHKIALHKLRGDRVGWSVSQNTRGPAQDWSRSDLESALDGWPSALQAPILATPAPAIRFAQEQDLYPLSRWQENRVVLIGDAAHAMTSGLGQGVSQALSDVPALVECLAALIKVEDGLAQYESARKMRAEVVVQQSAKVSRSEQRTGRAFTWVRKQLLQSAPAMYQRQLERFPTQQN